MVQWRDSYKDFRYDVAFTLSTNKNKVVKLSDQVNPIIWAGSDAALNSSIYRTEMDNRWDRCMDMSWMVLFKTKRKSMP